MCLNFETSFNLNFENSISLGIWIPCYIRSLTILFHHSLLSSVHTDHIIHIICDYQYFRPKTHIIYHSNNGILVVWQSVDMTWTWNPRYAQDKPYRRRRFGKLPQRQNIERVKFKFSQKVFLRKKKKHKLL